jgi:hypothetical protein
MEKNTKLFFKSLISSYILHLLSKVHKLLNRSCALAIGFYNLDIAVLLKVLNRGVFFAEHLQKLIVFEKVFNGLDFELCFLSHLLFVVYDLRG